MLKRIFIILSFSVLFTFSLSQAPNWDCDEDGVLDNYNDYANNGSITAAVYDESDNIGSLGDIFAAFVDDELRAVAQATEVPPQLGGGFAFLVLAYSNEPSGETLSFKFYDIETDTVYELLEEYEFVSDMTWGNVVSPELFNIDSVSSDPCITCDGSSCSEDSCDDIDEDGICDDVDECVGDYDECGVCNGEGIADGVCDCDGNVEDCAGDCGGSAFEDDCGVCNGDNSTCCYPCVGDNEACSSYTNIADCYEHSDITEPDYEGCTWVGSDGQGCDEMDVFGCMDNIACNFDENAAYDEGCVYPAYNHDCDGNCTATGENLNENGYDCTYGIGINGYYPEGWNEDNSCGGDALLDVCSNCGYWDEIDECEETCEDCMGECGGIAIADNCGVCGGDGTSCLAFLTLGAFNADAAGGTLEVLYDFGSEVSGFQFDVSGLDLTGGSDGAAGDAGLQVQAGPNATVIGFDLGGSSIPAGGGVLTVLSFDDVTADLTELTLGNGGAVSSPFGEVFTTTASGQIDHSDDSDCAGDYYGDSVEDDCGACDGVGYVDECGICDDVSENDCIQDCAEVWGGSSFPDCFGVCDGDATYDVCGVCDGDSSSCGLLDGHLNQETGWNFYQSSQIGFYGFQEIFIDGIYAVGDGWAPSSNADESECVNNPYSCDVVGAFLNGLCVGWTYADGIPDEDGNYDTTVPVMGYDDSNATSSQQTQGYCTESDTPIFLIFDSSAQTTYLLDVNGEIDAWVAYEFPNVFESASSAFADIGCTNSNAGNYDPDAVIDDGSCIYMQTMNFDESWNMFSFNVIPQEATLFDILSPIHEEMILVLDERGSAIFQDQNGINWYDNIGLWIGEEGYLIKMSQAMSFDVSSNLLIATPFVINLSKGWNLISYPIQSESDLVENVLSELIANQTVYMMFDESGNVFIPSYITGGETQNSIISMSPGNGYYIKVIEDSQLSIYEPSEEIFVDNSSEFIYLRTEHFIPIWDGNPFFPMTIIVDVATWNNVEISEGDEIGVFDGDLCVGAYVVPEGGFINNSGVQIITSKDDPEEGMNGFTNGNSVTFRLWRNSIEIDVDATILQFTDEEGNVISPLFEASSAPTLELNVYPPSATTAVNLDPTPLPYMVYLQWEPPLYGDYLIYENDSTHSAVTFQVVRNDTPIYMNLINNSYQDETVNYNTVYSYQITSISELGFDPSTSNEFIVLTRPGTPELTYDAFVNSIGLTWSDPSGTGSGSEIDYTLEREWVVGGQSYDKYFNNILSNAYSDDGLLNSSNFSYKVRAHNNSGNSDDWSNEVNVSTLSFQNGLTQVDINEIVYSVQQNTLFPDNEIEIDWSDIQDAQGYRVYDKNLLIEDGEVLISYFSHDDLENSTLYQYSITSINEEGESEASNILELTTLPEAAPGQPDNFTVSSNQNSLDLDWDHVQGYGNPIGGEAVSYRIYRFVTTTLDPDNLDAASPLTEIGNNSYNDINLEDNMYYCYAVSGVNGEGLEGGKTLIVCNSTQTQLVTSIPILSSQVNDRDAYLSWNESEGSPPITYQIYKQEKDNENNVLYDQFIHETSDSYYIDENLGRGQIYYYYVTSRNELGTSIPSNEEDVFISNQSSRLAAHVPENLLNLNDFLDPDRASGFIPDSSDLVWDAAQFTYEEADSVFYLSFEGNGFSHMSIIVNEISYNQNNIPDGSIIAIFDGGLCVGKGITPLPYGQLSTSADDGTGNGFTEGNEIYFKIWNSQSGNILTAYESPPLTFSQLALEFTSLSIEDDRYNMYRNGNLLIESMDTTHYVDLTLESELNYFYRVSAYNELDFDTESNLSSGDQITTENYLGSYPLFTQETIQFLSNSENTSILEDGTFNVELSATDGDNDFITYFAHPVNNSDPVSCFINGHSLEVIPAPDYFGSFEIIVYVYDDANAGYESNTYSDEITFTLTVGSINDPPIRLNYFEDILLQEADYCVQGDCPYQIDISEYIIDVDNLIMGEEQLNYDIQLAGEILDFSINENLLSLNFYDAGQAEVSISVSDQVGNIIEDSFIIIIEEILEADEIIPTSFNLSEVYPNPFNPIAYFNVEIPYNSMLEIQIYNILGQKVDKVFNGFILPGIHTMSWTPSSMPSGIYFVQMKTKNFVHTKKMILLK